VKLSLGGICRRVLKTVGAVLMVTHLCRASHDCADKSGWQPIVCVAVGSQTTYLRTDPIDAVRAKLKTELGLSDSDFTKVPAAFMTNASIASIADTDAFQGMTPLKWAAKGGHLEVVELLKKYGAKE